MQHACSKAKRLLQPLREAKEAALTWQFALAGGDFPHDSALSRRSPQNNIDFLVLTSNRICLTTCYGFDGQDDADDDNTNAAKGSLANVVICGILPRMMPYLQPATAAGEITFFMALPFSSRSRESFDNPTPSLTQDPSRIVPGPLGTSCASCLPWTARAGRNGPPNRCPRDVDRPPRPDMIRRAARNLLRPFRYAG